MKSLYAINYRPDIDGLRAVAVLTVIAFHAFPEWVSGGFIGVDIFFVISGFLITNLIQVRLREQNFSILAFYASRVRRLFPSLILVLLACQTFAWFALLSDEYKSLGKHISATALLIPNWIFWSESGYFDYAANTKPLLHLWSLGVEEQFYLFWPITLYLLFIYKLNAIRITSVLLLCSLLLNLLMIEKSLSATFFLPFTRIWELLAGSLLAFLTQANFKGFNPIRAQFKKYKST
jgi:peptidoglycan/LPS O-acetylase OafA/YrhL